MKPERAALLPAPEGRTGWPWTAPSGAPSAAAERGASPRVSIVTPSFNQAATLEATLRSVLLQDYSDVEYIVIDGGSTDGSVEIIRRYAPWLAHWESVPDRGQSHALNKGFARATGTAAGWMGSDDYFLPGGIAALVALREREPEAVAWAGACRCIYAGGRPDRVVPARVGDRAALADWGGAAYISQPACFFDLAAFRRVNGLDERLHFALDVDLWLRLANEGPFAVTDETVAVARHHPEAKSSRDVPSREAEAIAVAVMNGELEAAVCKLARYAGRGEGELRRKAGVYDAMEASFMEWIRYGCRRVREGIRWRLR